MVDKDKGPFGSSDIDNEPLELIFQKEPRNYSLKTHDHIMPLLMWLHNLVILYLHPFVVPSSRVTKHCKAIHIGLSGSIGLSNLHIESNGSSLILPPPTRHSDDITRPDRDNF
ncbi:hypothetical protein H5410_003253 [Solanum commersonii]|uniref:Uncharacterized protein n=1 Tax=Solanum commersonii TaxID=4109 RepID=A0A9J6B4I7_SOLCO|nr:hypothetical protein H5410_003253 [Solanum commersonii]